LPARLTETPRQRIRALLLSEPTFRQLNHAEITMKINVAPDTVRFACDSLVKDATLSECTHRLSKDGKMYGQRLTVEGGLIWNALTGDPELSRLSHTAIAARLSVTTNLVMRTCLALVRAGKLSECTHTLNEDGTVCARSHAVSRKWKTEAEAATARAQQETGLRAGQTTRDSPAACQWLPPAAHRGEARRIPGGDSA
jgi:hypothetical protein